MALLRPCGSVIRAFVKLSPTCQVILSQRIFVNKISIGYADSMLQKQQNFVYSTINNKQLHHFPNNTTQNNSLPENDLQNYLEALTTGYNNMNIQYEDLLYALKLYAHSNDNSNDKTAIFLLKCCGEVLCNIHQDQRQNLTHHVWNLFQKKVPQLTLEHYHTLLSIYAQNNNIINAPDFLKSMKVKPDEKTFLYLLNIAGKTGDLDVATFALTKMKELNYPLCQMSLNSLIEVYWKIGDIDSAVSTLDTIVLSGLKPQKELYANLACGYSSIGMIDEVLELLKNHSFDGRQVLRIIKHLSLTNDSKNSLEIFKYLPVEKIISDPILINTIIKLVHSDHLEEAEKIVQYFLDNEKSNKTFHLVEQFLSALVLSKQSPVRVLNIIKYLETIYDEKIILLKLLKASLRSSQRELSIEIFEKMKRNKIEIRTHYYWPLFVQASKEGELSIFSTIRHMLSLKVELDHTTLVEYIFPYVNTSDPVITSKKFTDLALKLSQVLTSLVCYYLEQGKITEIISLLTSTKGKLDFDKIIESLIKNFQIYNNVDNCIKILEFLPKNKDHAGVFLYEIFSKKLNESDLLILDNFIVAFQQHKIFISSDTLASLRNIFSSSINNKDNFNIIMKLNSILNDNLKKLNSERLSGIPHPSNMTLEQLECHYIELKSKNLNIRGLLRKLLIAHCKKGNLNRVEELKNEAVKLGIIMSPAMKAHLFDIYARNGNIDQVCSLLLDLQKNHPDFIIDSFKLVRAALALVKYNKIYAAIEILNSNKKASSNVSSDCFNLLDEIARSDYAEMTHDVLNILVKKNYCEINNTLLGPLIRRHIVKNDLVSAVENFDIVAKAYHMTPLRQELFDILVGSQSDEKVSQLLKTVTDIVVYIHGQETVDMEMIIAYARHGKMKELKNSLKVK